MTRTGKTTQAASRPKPSFYAVSTGTSAAEESDGATFCQLDSGSCELVKRLREPSLSSPLFKRIAEIAVSEPYLLATRLAEAGAEPRLALAIAAALMRERKDPPPCCKVCRATLRLPRRREP